ncbi:hypothetical protein [Cohnella panacarvi]|uniref:hypothetical protein n=1 Tax=Cohnella panacarvi TaxID=400776 RepID=UPI00047ECF1B|nr:hypothetical protein [Cohnella panacarvi]
MTSVTQRITQIKQPRGGYLKPKDFIEIVLDDGVELYPEENIHASLVGLAVEYMTRYTIGTPAEQAFKISLLGSSIVKQEDKARTLLQQVKGLDDQSIFNACKLVGYDVCRRAGIFKYRPVEEIHPDEKTIYNVRTMVKRSLAFWEHFGPVIKEGFTFESGYTQLVTSGDGDYLTEDTLWDFKVSKNAPTNKHTLQLLMYYILGRRSIHKEFYGVTQLGIYNPRFNKAYLLEISKIDSSLIKEVSTDVLGVI